MRRCDRHAGWRKRPRSGAAVVEAAVVLGLFLVILLGGLDLALAVHRDNLVGEAARRLARQAIVRGERAAAIHGTWGPQTYEGTAADGSEFAESIRGILVAVDPQDIQLRIDWPDGGNAVGDRVVVTVSTEHRPIVATLLGTESYVLDATSVMQIEH